MSDVGKDLIIHVNRREFGEGDGVEPRMTGGQIALLVGVRPDDAVVRLDRRGEKRKIGETEEIEIEYGDRFFVTRRSEVGEDLIIYVNRRKFDEGDGVKPRMTGGEIALLVDVPPDDAVIQLDRRGEKRKIGEREGVEIERDDHFSVTRRSEVGKDLIIYVNRRKFDEGDGVRPQMTGGQIALLVDVPPDNAVVRLDRQDEKREIGKDEQIEVKHDDHFLVTRKVVEGGCQ